LYIQCTEIPHVRNSLLSVSKCKQITMRELQSLNKRDGRICRRSSGRLYLVVTKEAVIVACVVQSLKLTHLQRATTELCARQARPCSVLCCRTARYIMMNSWYGVLVTFATLSHSSCDQRCIVGRSAQLIILYVAGSDWLGRTGSDSESWV